MLKKKLNYYKKVWKLMSLDMRNLIFIFLFWIFLVGFSFIKTGFFAFIEILLATFLTLIYSVVVEKIIKPYRFEVGKRYQTRFFGSGTIIKKMKHNGITGFLYSNNSGKTVFVSKDGMFNKDGKSISQHDLMLGELPESYPH